ncbi:hypothetical protein EDB87DRAFT_1692965 [Lactarius vividus]|nr:hypothetical protein EDB87DRAFT_1692965 [Lactarius vividus]
MTSVTANVIVNISTGVISLVVLVVYWTNMAAQEQIPATLSTPPAHLVLRTLDLIMPHVEPQALPTPAGALGWFFEGQGDGCELRMVDQPTVSYPPGTTCHLVFEYLNSRTARPTHCYYIVDNLQWEYIRKVPSPPPNVPVEETLYTYRDSTGTYWPHPAVFPEHSDNHRFHPRGNPRHNSA